VAVQLPIPDITHLQFFVLTALRAGVCSGPDLRARLRRRGVRRSGPAFYQMMARLEDAGLVAGRYARRVVDGQAIKERHYEITPAGDDAWTRTRDFYLGAIPQARLAEGGDG
jgi:DNA-binding PadR family transcriptional regulator